MNIEKVTRYGLETYENSYMDGFRRKECLCYNCAEFTPDDENCPIAQKLYKLCVENNMAMIITRCKWWIKK